MPFEIRSTPVNINISAANQVVALPDSSTSKEFDILVTNDGTATAFVRFGSSSLVITTSNAIPIRSGATLAFKVPPGTTHAAAIAAGATGRVYFTLGKDL